VEGIGGEVGVLREGRLHHISVFAVSLCSLAACFDRSAASYTRLPHTLAIAPLSLFKEARSHLSVPFIWVHIFLQFSSAFLFGHIEQSRVISLL
jgi:hypothetical protein